MLTLPSRALVAALCRLAFIVAFGVWATSTPAQARFDCSGGCGSCGGGMVCDPQTSSCVFCNDISVFCDCPNTYCEDHTCRVIP
jgi:hypothetical protein